MLANNLAPSYSWTTSVKDISSHVFDIVATSISFERSSMTRPSFINRKENIGLDLISSLFSYNNYQEISKFIIERKHLMPLLIDGYLNIRKIFGDVSLTLRLEGEDVQKKLYLLINVDGNLEDAYDLLDKLDQQWWNENALLSRFDMNIDLEY